MKSVIYGQDERVLKWVGDRTDEDDFGPGSIAIGLEEDNELIAGVAFNMYTKASICMHVAAMPGKRWMTRDFLWRSFAYPFIQLGCNRV
ncbi:N-acetyltransferase, partial [bacterium]|nr:N-acetyltransferase [bacterium]